MQAATRRIAIQPGDGERDSMATGVGVIYKIDSDDTGAAFALLEHPVPAGVFVPPHTHRREDELSYVASGRIMAWVGQQVHDLPTGSYLIKPRGIAHAFWNPTQEPALILEVIWPPAMASAFREMAQAEQRSGGPDQAEMAAIAAKYEIYPNPELVPWLVEKYGLRPPKIVVTTTER
jgi:quercetin dioxygenase-like cupin family protein